MDSQIVETVTGWDSEPFSGGYAGLRRLVEREFSGAVTDGSAWLFALNGRVIGIFDGRMESFENADGTAYRAPDLALPLLFVMQERGGEVRAEYYTNDTPLSEADETLSSGKFTGYVELSENVLSGDYYVAYYGGKSMSAAFVGNGRKLVTGEEAFRRADDEVGIYQVRAVDIEVRDVPPAADADAEGDDEADGSADRVAGAGSDDENAPADDDGSATAPPVREQAADEPPAAESAAADSAEPDAASPAAAPTGPSERSGSAESSEPSEPADAESAPATANGPPSGGTADGSREASDAGSTSDADAAAPAVATDSGAGSDADGPDATAATSEAVAGADVFSEEQQWRSVRSIPSIDPKNSESAGNGAAATTKERPGEGQRSGPERQQSAEQRGVARQRRRDAPSTDDGANAGAAAGTEAGAAAGADASEAARRIERLRRELSEARAERDRLESERNEAVERAERLESRVAELEAQLRRIESDDGAGTDAGAAGRQLSPAAAVGGTNLFVRYASKGDSTLETAHADRADREAVNENLRLEHHTSFDAAAVTVEGRPYAEFLADTVEYGFARWFVEDLLYEIRDTGNVGAMRELFDAIPSVDRIELGGEVAVADPDDDEGGVSHSFDVVFRDRMGDPLAVATLNDSRDPASGTQLESLIGRGGEVGEAADSLAGAFAVTTSFFEPEALETAAGATDSGLLGGKKKSHVKLSRKTGFHLCLVETRDGEYHLNVPEL